MTTPILDNSKVILFDGVCNFCNYWVNFILDRDTNNLFKFAPLQSVKGMELLLRFNLPQANFDSFILIIDKELFFKSKAVFKIAKELNGWPKIITVFSFLPNHLTDFVYDIMAKNRYRLFGKNDVCRIPSAAEKSKFLV